MPMHEIEVTWETIFETGNDHVDNQHKKLFELIKEFCKAYTFRMEKNIIDATLFELEDYARIHFSDEENLLSQHKGLPTGKHLKQHQDFIQILRNLKFDYVSDDTEISNDLFFFLTNWLRDHILGIDKIELNKI